MGYAKIPNSTHWPGQTQMVLDLSNVDTYMLPASVHQL